MLGGVIAEFLARVGFKADEAQMKDALGKVKDFAVGIGVAAGAATAAIGMIARKYDDLGRASKEFRTSISDLQEWRFAAEATVGSSEALDASLAGMIANNPGLKDTSAALNKAREQMLGMSDAARVLYAQRLGIDPKLIPTLVSDVDALRSEFRSLASMSGINAEQAAESARKLMGEWTRLKTIGTMVADAVGIALFDKLRLGAEKFRRAIVENFDRIRRVLETFVSIILRVAGAVIALIGRIIGWVMRLVDGFLDLDRSTQIVIAAIGGLLIAWRSLNAGILATPIGWIIGGLIALIALVDDYFTYLEGGQSLLDWGPYAETIEKVIAVMKQVGQITLGVLEGIAAAAGPVFKALGVMFDGVATHLGLVFDLIKALFTGDLQGVMTAAEGIVDNYVSTVQNATRHMIEGLVAFMTAVWASIEKTFPDFAGWARSAANSIMSIFGNALGWVRDKMTSLLEWLPDSIKDAVGLGQAAIPAMAGATAGSAAPVRSILPEISSPALTPSPSAAAQAAGAGQTTNKVTIQQTTEIKVSASDPEAAGRAVGRQQDDVNASLARNTRSVIQ